MKAVATMLLMAAPASAQTTCADLRKLYKGSECCGTPSKVVDTSGIGGPGMMVGSPPLAGILPGTTKAKINLGYDIWSPYVYIDDTTGEPTGFGPEFVKLMQKSSNEACAKLDISMVQDGWERMWSDTGMPGSDGKGAKLGDGSNYGLYHGGMTYTHLKGLRPRMGHFSYAITMPSSQPSGLIVKLKDGKPMFSGTSDLNGATIVDVAGYAPTPDTFANVQNWCQGGAFFSKNVTFVAPSDIGNKAAMKVFKERADVQLMYVYGDQADDCAGTNFAGDCEGWEGLGTEYAYLHIGLSPNVNGTTICYGKKNSGVYELVNPCIQAVMETKDYRDLCNAPLRPPDQMSTNMAACYPNSFWTEEDYAKQTVGIYTKKQAERTDSKTCADGYCTCSE